MAVSIRLHDRLDKQIAALAKSQGISKSELIRRCLNQYLAQANQETAAWELGKDLFGCWNSGQGDLSVRAKEIAREKIHARRAKKNHR